MQKMYFVDRVSPLHAILIMLNYKKYSYIYIKVFHSGGERKVWINKASLK